MAKAKKIAPVSKEAVILYFKKPEMWVGLSVLLVIVGFSLYSVGSRVLNSPAMQTGMVDSQAAKTVVSPTVMAIEKESSPAVETVQKEQPKVTRLANTSGLYSEVAYKGDNFWKISKRVCGTGMYYEAIKAYNGYNEYRALQPGDVVTVVCSF